MATENVIPGWRQADRRLVSCQMMDHQLGALLPRLRARGANLGEVAVDVTHFRIELSQRNFAAVDCRHFSASKNW